MQDKPSMHVMLPVSKAKTTEWPTTRGAFDVKSVGASTRLHNLALDLERQTGRIAGIPNPWAWPMLFAMAVLDPDHPYHEKARSQWRGLLALFALRRALHVPVRAVSMAQPRSDRFARIALNLTPGRPLDENAPWAAGAVFAIKDDAFAMTNAWCVVSPSPESPTALVDLAWWEPGAGRLTDPCGASGVSESMKGTISQFLDRFFSEDRLVAKVAEDMNDVATALVTQLRLFKKVLGNADASDAEFRQDADDWLKLSGFYGTLSWYGVRSGGSVPTLEIY